MGKSGTGTGTGIFRVKAGRGSRFLGKRTGTGFLSKGGTRLAIWFLKGQDGKRELVNAYS